MPTYVFREGMLPLPASAKSDAQRIGECWVNAVKLAQHQAASRNKSRPPVGHPDETAARIIHRQALAEGKGHPFHVILEWNDKKAALQWRLTQIRQVGGLIRVISEETGEPERPVLWVKAIGDLRGSFRPVDNIKGSLDLQISVLRAAERDLESFQRRYRSLADICAGAARLQALAQQQRERLMMSAAGGADTATAA